ncbi:MAG: hypothetical protein K8J08_22810 [Thermoanaerobaculia bacterium]|nr:hypothetical protein [Thermoanaerobaculia bacterium]
MPNIVCGGMMLSGRNEGRIVYLATSPIVALLAVNRLGAYLVSVPTFVYLLFFFLPTRPPARDFFTQDSRLVVSRGT